MSMQSIFNRFAESCVAEGATWLDSVRPGWVEEINLDRFYMSDPSQCILGQLYGNFHTPLRSGVLTGPMAAARGFVTSYFGCYSYAELSAAWVALIRARRAGQ